MPRRDAVIESDFSAPLKTVIKDSREILTKPTPPDPSLHVLVVDDDKHIQKACCQILLNMEMKVAAAETLGEAQRILRRQKVDLVLLDLMLPDGSGLTLLEEVRVLYPDTAVVVMTAFATVSTAVEAMRIGARDYLTKPFALEELTTVIERSRQRAHLDRESRLLRERLRSQEDGNGLVGRSLEMEKLYRILSKVTFSRHPVLILGESGTGKEMVARAIHFNGPNAAKPFVLVDCGSLVPSLMESELFGHVKGVFTGDDFSKDGCLAVADGGTVFLNEIGELPLDLQAKLLRSLQEKEIRPVGATHARPISTRVLAASSRDIATMVEQGKFRKDLFFRLNIVSLKIPPLRERREDIPLLAMHFLTRMERVIGVERTLSDDSLQLMMEYDWPGNVRELENTIEYACTLSNEPVLHLGDMPTRLQDLKMRRDAETTSESMAAPLEEVRSAVPGEGEILPIAEMEKQAILGTIRHLNGDKLLAAKMLGIGKTTLYRKLKEYGIEAALYGISA